MKLLVVTGSFQAGAVIDDETKVVTITDHWLAHLRGMTEADFREYCRNQKWAVTQAE